MARDTADVRLNFLAVGADKIKTLFSQIDTQRKALNNSPVSIKIGADDESANEKISEVFRQLEALNHSRANISMAFPDYASARAKLDDLKNMTSALNGKVIRESIKIDGLGKATLDFAALAKLQDDQNGRKTSFSGGSGSGGSAGGILGALPAAEGLLNPYTITTALAALPFAAQAAAGGITLAFGGAFAALAAVGASKAKSVQDSFADLKTDASNDLTDIGKPFIPVMNSILSTARSTMNKLTPLFASVIVGISKPFQSFSDTFIATLGGPNVRNALTSLGTAFGSVLTALTPQLPGDINAIADGLKRIGDAVSKNPKAIADFVSALFHIAGFALDAIAGLTNVATYVEQHFVPAFDQARHDVANWWDGLINDLTSTWDQYWDNTIGRTIRGGHDIEAAFNTTKQWLWDNFVSPLENFFLKTFPSAVTSSLSWISNTWDTVWNTLRKGFLVFILDGVLAPLGLIIDGAAHAFGWIPGIGGQLKTAAKAFDQFRVNVNNAINGIGSHTVDVQLKLNTGQGIPGVTVGIPAGVAKAAGGAIRGVGSGTSDSNLIWASRGEYVVKASSVSKYGVGFMDAVNAGHFADGGMIVDSLVPSAGQITSTLWKSVSNLIQSAVKDNLGAMLNPGAGITGVAGTGAFSASAAVAQNFARSVLWAYGWSQSQMPSLIALWNQESGWRWNATNPSSGAYGIPQSLPADKMASAGGDWRTNYQTQIRWGLGYISAVYGSPAGAEAHELAYNWYDRGGWLAPGYTLAYNGTGAAERVSPPGQSAGNSYVIQVSPTPLAHPRDIGREVVGAIREFEKGAGSGWRQ